MNTSVLNTALTAKVCVVMGAGGNKAKTTKTNEYHHQTKNIQDCTTFFDLEKSGVEFVFALNWTSTLLPTQVFA